MNDKLLIVYRTNTGKDDSDALAASLKTLELRPPSIEYEVHVACEHDTPFYDELASGASGLHLLRTEDGVDADLRAAVRRLVSRDDYTFVMVLHPDVLFLHPDWCDAVLSRMLASGVQVMGSNQYLRMSYERGEVALLSSWLYVMTADAARQLEERFSDDPLYGAAMNHINTVRLSGQRSVAGGSFDGIFHHLSTCAADCGKGDLSELRECVEEARRV